MSVRARNTLVNKVVDLGVVKFIVVLFLAS